MHYLIEHVLSCAMICLELYIYFMHFSNIYILTMYKQGTNEVVIIYMCIP